MNNFGEYVSFIWNVADLLRGPYRPNQYGRVILPMTVLRRLDCVLEPTKDKVLRKAAELKGKPEPLIEKLLQKEAKQKFFNTSKYTFERLAADPNSVAANLTKYLKGFSVQARDILDKFGLETELAKLDERDLLFLIVKKFAAIDLHPEKVDNRSMGYIFEELIRKFNEAANEEAGDHFTPREVIRLMVDLLFAPDHQLLTQPRIVRTLFDPACGTGGMLSVAQEYLARLNPQATLELFGQDWNEQAYAVCGSDMLIKGQNIENIKFGSSFTADGFPDDKFDYMLANPPFGVKWEADEKKIKDEYDQEGETGRFGAGLPRINDGSFLFLQHMISKRKPVVGKEGGSRIGIVFNGSPLFTGDAGSGESNIRRWIIENDWLEAIVALPDQLFYNTGIYTYIWIVTNRKAKERRGKVQLINAVDLFTKMRKSLGNKRNEIAETHREEIVALYRAYVESERSKIFDNEDFGYHQITVERPLRLNFAVTPERLERLKAERGFQNLAASKKKGKAAEEEITAGEATQQEILRALQTMDTSMVWRDRAEFELLLENALNKHDLKTTAPLKKALLSSLGERDETAEICRDPNGDPEADSDLRDYENVPLKEDIHEYLDREVKPHVPDAWIDEERTKVGYEIPLTRHFYRYIPPRPIEDIQAEIAQLEKEIVGMLREVVR
ncbi:MAG TPA: N-6 DNA methylase [Bryobacteraceae bacterium]|nr:N-6 DNA methylase [Bryobacteraceae bacterium]